MVPTRLPSTLSFGQPTAQDIRNQALTAVQPMLQRVSSQQPEP